MSKTDAIEIFAKSVFSEDKKVISTDEFNELVEKPKRSKSAIFIYIFTLIFYGKAKRKQ